MNCPPAIAEIILEIIQTAVLRIRMAAWAGDVGRAADEADHIHNLPSLLLSYSPERLKYYWDIERSSIVEKKVDTKQFEALWQKLRPHLELLNQPGLPSLVK